MNVLKKCCAVLLLCSLVLTLICSCEKSDGGEQSYIDGEEIVAVTQRKVDKNNLEDGSMNISDNSSKNGSVGSNGGNKPGSDNSKETASLSNSAKSDTAYKYEYEFFDKRYYNNSVLSAGNLNRLKGVFKKAKSGGKVTIAFIGGSITEGTGADKSTCYSALVAKWFERKFKTAKIEYLNAGIGTAGSLFGVHRVDNDVISHSPDVVFVDFAVNDKGKNPDTENATFDALIQKLYNNSSKPAIICVAMATKTGWNSEKSENLICREYNISMLSFSKYIHSTIYSGKYLWKDIFADDVHPNKAGHKIISELVIYYLEKALGELNKKDASIADTIKKPYTPESSRFLSAKRLNPAKISVITNKGFSVVKSEFQHTNGYFESKTQNSEISFSVKAKTLTLFYGKLPSDGGRFQLYVDGELIKEYACATGDTWEYINSEIVAGYNSVENRKVTIKNISESGKRILISGIGVTL